MSLLRQFSKVLMPSLDRDLGRSIGKELSTMDDMVSNFLAPSVYGYEKATPKGAFGASMKHNEPQSFVKVNYPIPQPGLFK